MNSQKKVWNAGYVVFLLFFSAAVSQGQDWTQWRGPFGNGITDEGDWNPKKLNSDPNSVVRWCAKIGQGHGALCVKGNHVYGFGNPEVRSRNGENTNRRDVVWCLNAETGKQIWRRAYPAEAGDFPGPRGTPVLDGDRLYTMGRHGELFCLNADTGKVIWHKHLENDFGIQCPGGGFSSSAIIYEDLLLLTGGESGVALNKLTGEPVWTSDVHKGASQATPVLFKQGEKVLAAIMSEDRLYAVDVRTGAVQWNYDWTSSMDPVFSGDRIYLSNNFQKGCSLISIESGSPEALWTKNEIKGDFSGYVLKDNFVYGCSQDGKLHCIDLKDGNVQWQHEIGNLGSLCLAQDMLIVITEPGRLFIVQATPERYQEIATYHVFKRAPADEQKQMGERWSCWTIPVLADGCIYVRNTDGDVACLDVRK